MPEFEDRWIVIRYYNGKPDTCRVFKTRDKADQYVEIGKEVDAKYKIKMVGYEVVFGKEFIA